MCGTLEDQINLALKDRLLEELLRRILCEPYCPSGLILAVRGERLISYLKGLIVFSCGFISRSLTGVRLRLNVGVVILFLRFPNMFVRWGLRGELCSAVMDVLLPFLSGGG